MCLNYIKKKLSLHKIRLKQDKSTYLNVFNDKKDLAKLTLLSTEMKTYDLHVKMLKYKIITSNKSICFKNKTQSLNKKLQSILKDQVLNLQTVKYVNQFFKINIQLYLKNVKRFIKNSARKLNKILYKQLQFYQKFKFLKDTIYIKYLGYNVSYSVYLISINVFCFI